MAEMALRISVTAIARVAISATGITSGGAATGAFGASAFCGSEGVGSAAWTETADRNKKLTTTAMIDGARRLQSKLRMCSTIVGMLLT